MTHAWFDLTAGVAGDMILGSLLDAGAPLAGVQKAVDAVAPGAVRLSVDEVVRGGQRASKLQVEVLRVDAPHRHWASLRVELANAELHELTRERALAVFGLLADAEARVHATTPEEVHFHEVGALDSIADVVGTCEALRLLGVESLSASGIAVGAGRIATAHGVLPAPVPAVVELMIGWRTVAVPGASRTHAHDRGTPSQLAAMPSGADVAEPGELATPTGVALIRALASSCEALPGMTISRVGVGAGDKNFPGHSNVVRAVLGEAGTTEQGPRPSTVSLGMSGAAEASAVMIEQQANVDDLDPRLWPGVIEACLAAGAADAWLSPIVMKKGRPAHTLHALVTPEASGAVADVILRHTTTLGVREVVTHRHVLDRTFVTLDVEGRPLTVKVGTREGRVVHAAAEFESLAALAANLGRPQSDLAQRAAAAIVEAGLVPGADAPS